MSPRTQGGFVKILIGLAVGGAWWLGGFAAIGAAVVEGVRAGAGSGIAQPERAALASKYFGARPLAHPASSGLLQGASL
jgi:hypothetical protein